MTFIAFKKRFKTCLTGLNILYLSIPYLPFIYLIAHKNLYIEILDTTSGLVYGDNISKI